MLIKKLGIITLTALLATPVLASPSPSDNSDPDALSQIDSLEQLVGTERSLCDAPAFEAFSGELLIAQGCCKTCRKGKACGNSCISRSYECHKPPGCACDG